MAMLDVAVVGGGLCGLALAHSLQARQRDWALFEARPRLGGRVLTGASSRGLPLDLGPTWFWPATQPSMARLVADLGLATLAQPDDGQVLLLDDPNRAPRLVAFDPHTASLAPEGTPAQPGSLHAGARRLAGGMGALVAALERRLEPGRMRLEHALEAVTDFGSHVELELRHGDALVKVQARRVVLALPPRIAAASVFFEPALPAALMEALQHTPTWMAAAAKAALAVPRPAWREAGHTGNAWSTHAQAVLAETFDASPSEPSAAGAALAGFVALDPDQRRHFERSLPLLVQSQVAMLFGPEAAAQGEVHLQDWAQEPYTCAAADLADGATGGHPAYGHALLQDAQWMGRLWLAGSESARAGGGYLEGALSAAARVRRQLDEATAHDSNEDALQRFDRWMRQQREDSLQRYRSQVHEALSQQRDEQLTQRALLGALGSLYAEALAELRRLPLATAGLALEQGRHALTPRVLQPFMGLSDELLDEAVRFNRTSCALSNFPYEHQPDPQYVKTIRRDLAAAWQDFALQVNEQLRGRPA
jgi:monoamine oxidase